MMEKLAEDDRIEQMNAQKRRMKQLEHKRAVEQLLEGFFWVTFFIEYLNFQKEFEWNI